MTAFTEIATPHKDIFEGRFTLEAYASDLWDVAKGNAPEEYRDRELFFSRTYETEGIKQIVLSAEERLKGKMSDSVVQLQTPFGGGKTHTLIYLYHKAKEWNAKVFVFSGDKIGAKDITIWEEMERQLSGRVEEFKGRVPPGGEKLRIFLNQYEPLLILMDEVHAYLVGGQAEKAGDSNLATQTLLFIQTLTNIIKSMQKTIMFVSLPASSPYSDPNSQTLLMNLQQIIGRVERVYTPVNDEEVSDVIRRRLFASIDEKKAKKVIKEFIDFAERENLFPQGVETSYYRNKFLKTYPFQPEIIDVIYKRWGSFPTFQRTRGVLRLLALVVNSVLGLKRSYIRLADFNLSNENIRRELVKHIGQEYDSIIAQDITSENSGARKVDKSLGDSYKPYYFGTAVATTIFMYSFSGAEERGATVNELKLSASDISVSSSIISETIENLKANLFYLADGGLFFKNRPNLNKVLIDKIEGIRDEKIENAEKDLLINELQKYLENYLWPRQSKDIPDTPSLKLVIIRKGNNIKDFFENYGERPRIHKNTLIFLLTEESERMIFENELKKNIAWNMIAKDSNIPLAEEQKRDLKDKIKKSDECIKTLIKNLYRKICVPSKEGFKEIDLGISTYGQERSIDKEVYERLKTEGEIVPNIAPKVLLDKYLKDCDFVESKKIYESFMKVPGELRIPSEEVFKTSVKNGVKEGIFGLGRIEEQRVVCLAFKKECEVDLGNDEILVKKEICEKNIKSTADVIKEEKTIYEHKKSAPNGDILINKTDTFSEIKIAVNVPPGKFSDFMGPMRLINAKFKNVSIKISLEASDGAISKAEFEDKIKEAFKQSEIIVEYEDVIGN
ncbi:MAG: DUF499 domain-containing protein [Thermodesulfovibrionales bacterium]|nr:DUF499 domain-containing protein [Thermodesulfovibrionales bacterium]